MVYPYTIKWWYIIEPPHPLLSPSFVPFTLQPGNHGRRLTQPSTHSCPLSIMPLPRSLSPIMLQTLIHSFYLPPHHSLTHSHCAPQLKEHLAGLRRDVEGRGELRRDQRPGERWEVVGSAELPLDDKLVVGTTAATLVVLGDVSSSPMFCGNCFLTIYILFHIFDLEMLVARSCLLCLIWMCLSGSC